MRGQSDLLLCVIWLVSFYGSLAQATANFNSDEFLVILTCRKGNEARIAAGRAAREGIQTVVVSSSLSAVQNKSSLPAGLSENHERWLYHKERHLEELAPFVAFQNLKNSFKWVFVGEDDTLFFRQGAATAVQNMDPDMPYFLSDNAWFLDHKGQRHYAKDEAPRCVPCNYDGNASSLPPHISIGCPCTVSGMPPDGFCGPRKEPSVMYSVNGGPGYIMSIGLLKQLSLRTMQDCFAMDGSLTLAKCLWHQGVGATDPNPFWHPKGLTFFDPTPAPYLTHDNIMEKTAHSLGRLLRFASGTCTGLCQVEVEHAISLHLNTAKIGYLRSGEAGNGPFQNAGQRENVGQQLLRSLSDFYGKHVLGSQMAGAHSSSSVDLLGAQILAEAVKLLQGMAAFFEVDAEELKDFDLGVTHFAEASEHIRTAVAATIARKALNEIMDGYLALSQVPKDS